MGVNKDALDFSAFDEHVYSEPGKPIPLVYDFTAFDENALQPKKKRALISFPDGSLVEAKGDASKDVSDGSQNGESKSTKSETFNLFPEYVKLTPHDGLNEPTNLISLAFKKKKAEIDAEKPSDVPIVVSGGTGGAGVYIAPNYEQITYGNDIENKIKEDYKLKDEDLSKLYDEIKDFPTEEERKRTYINPDGSPNLNWTDDALSRMRSQDYPKYLAYINLGKTYLNLRKLDPETAKEYNYLNSEVYNLESENIQKLNSYDRRKLFNQTKNKQNEVISKSDKLSEDQKNILIGYNNKLWAAEAERFINNNEDAKDYLSQNLRSSLADIEVTPTWSNAFTSTKLYEGEDIDTIPLSSLEKNVDQSNPFDVRAFEVYKYNRSFNDAVQKSPTIEEAAINYYSSLDPRLAEQREKLKKDGLDLPNELKAEYVGAFLQDPRTKRLAETDPSFKVLYRQSVNSFEINYPEFSVLRINDIISQAREDRGMNNPIINIPTESGTRQLVDDLVAEGKLTEADKIRYMKYTDPKVGVGQSLKRGATGISLAIFPDLVGTSPIKTPGVTENFLTGYQKTISDIVKSGQDLLRYTLPFSDGTLVPSETQRLYATMTDNARTARVNFNKVNEISEATGNLIGFIPPMIFGGEILEGLGFGSKAAHAINAGFMFEGANRDRALTLFPNDPVKRNAFVYLSTAGDMFLTELLPTKYMRQGISKVLKKDVAEITEALANKSITPQIATNTLFNKTISYIPRVAIENAKQAGTMSILFGGYHKTLESLFGANDLTALDNMYETVKEFKHTFLTTPILAILAVKGKGRPESRKVDSKILMELASAPEFYKQKIIDYASKNGESKQVTEQKLRNLNNAANILSDLQKTQGLTPPQKEKFFIYSVAEKALIDEAKNTTDTNLKQKYLKEAKGFSAVKENILNGSDKATEFYTYEPKPTPEEQSEIDKQAEDAVNRSMGKPEITAEELKAQEGVQGGVEQAGRGGTEAGATVLGEEKLPAGEEQPVEKEQLPKAEETKQEVAKEGEPTVTGIEQEEIVRQIKPITDEMANTEREFKNNGFNIDTDYDNEIIITDKNGEIVDPEDLPDNLRKMAAGYESATSKLGQVSDIAREKALAESRKVTEVAAEEVKPGELPKAEEKTQEVISMSDSDIENRMTEIQNKAKSTLEENREFDILEKEMEKRERNSVFGVTLDKVNNAIDALMKKEKEMPNGWGSFIDKRDARETKEVADRYLNAKQITDNDLKKDFSNALRGNPTTWYADGLQLRESLKEASNRGIDTSEMVNEAVKVYTDAGYDIDTARSVVANMLKPIFEGATEAKAELPEGEKPAVYTIENVDQISTEGLDKDKASIVKSIKNTVKAVANLAKGAGKNISVTVHTSPSTYAKAVIESGGKRQDSNTRGFYLGKNGSVHINLERAGTDTVPHEVFHFVLDFMKDNNPELVETIYNQLNSFGEGQRFIESNKKRYTGEVTQKKEAITDFIAHVADGSIVINPSNFAKIKKFIIDSLNKIGFDLKTFNIAEVKDAKELVDLAQLISEKFKKGEEIKKEDLGLQGETKINPSIKREGSLFFSRTNYGKSGIEKVPALDTDKFEEDIKSGRVNVVDPKESLKDKTFAINQPDDLYVGDMNVNGEKVASLGGGIIYVAENGADGGAWASVSEGSAKTFVDNANKSLEKNGGEGVITFVKGSDIKHATSLDAKLSLVKTLLKYADGKEGFDGLVNAIKEVYSIGNAKKASTIIDLFDNYLKSGRMEDGLTMNEAKTTYDNFRASLIKNANPIITKMMIDMGFNSPEYFDATQLKKGNYKATGKGLDVLFADLFQEDFLKDVPTGSAYAAIKFSSKLTFERRPGHHPSYPVIIKTVDGSPVKLELFDKTFMVYGENQAVTGREPKPGQQFTGGLGQVTTTVPNFKLKSDYDFSKGSVSLKNKLYDYSVIKENKPQYSRGEDPLKDVESTTKALDDIIPFERKRQEAVNLLPTEKINFRDIKGVGDLSIYFNNPEALKSGNLRSAYELYEKLKNGEKLKDKPYLTEKNELLDGQNRIAAQLALGNENIDVVKIGKDFFTKSETQQISEAYHKAKADGSNPELVKAVEDAIGGKGELQFSREEEPSGKEEEVNDKIKKLMPESATFNKLSKPANRSKLFQRNGIGYAEYTNPDNGSVDIYVSAFGSNDFIAFIRVYEKGKPTNRFTSKMVRRSDVPGATRGMMTELQNMLPKDHELSEDRNISTDGIRFFASQLDKGYELLKDEQGNPVTTRVAINGQSKVNDLGIPVPGGRFNDLPVKTEEDFQKAKSVISNLLEKLGIKNPNITWGKRGNVGENTILFDLPVLVKKESIPEVEPEPKKVGLSKAEINKQVEDFSMLPPERLAKVTDKELDEAADAAILNGFNVQSLVDRLRKYKGSYFYDPTSKKFVETESVAPANPLEVRILNKYAAALNAEQTSKPSVETLKKYTEVMDAAKKAFSITGATLRQAQTSQIVADNLSNFLVDKEAAQGSPLTEEQLKEQKELYDESQRLLKEVQDQLKVEIEKNILKDAEIARLKSQKTSSRAKSKRTEVEYKQERKSLLEKAKEALLRLRGTKGKGGEELNYSREEQLRQDPTTNLMAIAPVIKEMMGEHLGQNVEKLEDIVNLIHEDLKELDNLTGGVSKSQIIEVIAGKHDAPPIRTRNELANKKRLMKEEASLLLKLADAKKGLEKAKNEKNTQKQVATNTRIEGLKKAINEIKKFNKESQEMDSEIKEDNDQERLTKKYKQLLSAIDRLESQLRNKDYLEEKKELPPLKLDARTRAAMDRYYDLQTKIREERIRDIMNRESTGRKVFRKTMDILGIRRLMQTSFDVSVSLRQGAPLLKPGTSRIWLKSFIDQFKSIKSANYNVLMFQIRNSEKFHEMLEDGIVFNDINTPNEDYSNSNFIIKLPGVKASQRAADGFLNTARYELYMKFTKNLEDAGYSRQTHPQQFKDAAKFAMNMTGRGNLIKSLEHSDAQAILGNTFFGARLMASRFNLLNPVYYARISPGMRKIVIRDMLSWASTQLAVGYALSKIPGVSVSTNPDDSDFLQVRYKNKVYDITGGMSMYLRTAVRITQPGISYFLDPKYKLAKKQEQAGKSAIKFFRNKLAPNPSYVMDFFLGRQAPGGFNPKDFLKAYPMYIDDVVDAWKDEGAYALVTVLLPNVVGIGFGGYGKKGELETDLDQLLRYNKDASEIDYSKFKNNNDGGRLITDKEFDKYAEEVDKRVEKGIKELFEKGDTIVGDSGFPEDKKYSEMTPDQVNRSIKSLKERIRNKVREEMFGTDISDEIDERIRKKSQKLINKMDELED